MFLISCKKKMKYICIFYTEHRGLNMLYLESTKGISFQGFPRVYLLRDQDNMQ